MKLSEDSVRGLIEAMEEARELLLDCSSLSEIGLDDIKELRAAAAKLRNKQNKLEALLDE